MLSHIWWTLEKILSIKKKMQNTYSLYIVMCTPPIRRVLVWMIGFISSWLHTTTTSKDSFFYCSLSLEVSMAPTAWGKHTTVSCTTLLWSLARNNVKKEAQVSKNYIYSIPCECGRKYIEKKGKPLNVRITEQKRKTKNGRNHKIKNI
jgi:hypothetical protein